MADDSFVVPGAISNDEVFVESAPTVESGPATEDPTVQVVNSDQVVAVVASAAELEPKEEAKEQEPEQLRKDEEAPGVSSNVPETGTQLPVETKTPEHEEESATTPPTSCGDYGTLLPPSNAQLCVPEKPVEEVVVDSEKAESETTQTEQQCVVLESSTTHNEETTTPSSVGVDDPGQVALVSGNPEEMRPREWERVSLDSENPVSSSQSNETTTIQAPEAVSVPCSTETRDADSIPYDSRYSITPQGSIEENSVDPFATATTPLASKSENHEGTEPLVCDQNQQAVTNEQISQCLDTATSTSTTNSQPDSCVQNALANRVVAIVGLGCVGAFCAELLVRSGVGTLILIDRQEAEPQDRRLVYCGNQNGNPSTILKEMMQKINPEVTILEQTSWVDNIVNHSKVTEVLLESKCHLVVVCEGQEVQNIYQHCGIHYISPDMSFLTTSSSSPTEISRAAITSALLSHKAIKFLLSNEQEIETQDNLETSVVSKLTPEPTLFPEKTASPSPAPRVSSLTWLDDAPGDLFGQEGKPPVKQATVPQKSSLFDEGSSLSSIFGAPDSQKNGSEVVRQQESSSHASDEDIFSEKPQKPNPLFEDTAPLKPQQSAPFAFKSSSPPPPPPPAAPAQTDSIFDSSVSSLFDGEAPPRHHHKTILRPDRNLDIPPLLPIPLPQSTPATGTPAPKPVILVSALLPTGPSLFGEEAISTAPVAANKYKSILFEDDDDIFAGKKEQPPSSTATTTPTSTTTGIGGDDDIFSTPKEPTIASEAKARAPSPKNSSSLKESGWLKDDLDKQYPPTKKATDFNLFD
ncbi:hypothetical protein Pelo_2012 [Pelomyxa schiedti]|nr:hypothetical protein Pelo_2012 [Pelomyxa schiedti]